MCLIIKVMANQKKYDKQYIQYASLKNIHLYIKNSQKKKNQNKTREAVEKIFDHQNVSNSQKASEWKKSFLTNLSY